MAAIRDSYFPENGAPDIGFEPHSTVSSPSSQEHQGASTRMTPRPGAKRKASKSSKSGRTQRNGSRSIGDRIRSHRNHSATNRDIQARRRKEKIRRRKRKHNRCAMLEKLIERLDRQPEAEAHSLVGVTCRDVSYFVILFSVVLFLRAAISLYTQSVLDQIRLRYDLAGSQLDLIKGTETIGFIVTVIFVGFFGRRGHKPLLMTCGVFVLALGAMIWPVPYFVTSTTVTNTTDSCNAKTSPLGLDVAPTFYGQLCQIGSKNSSSFYEACSSCLKDKTWTTNRDTFVHVLYLAGFLIGFGTGLFLTTGTLYIEAAKRQKDSPLQYGFLFFMNGLGEFLGSAFAWWFLSYPENLKAGSALYPWSVRAWWLGMVIFSCMLFLLSWTFLFFPKWIIEPSWSIGRRHARLARLTKLLDAAKRDRQKRREQMKRDKQRQKRGKDASAKGDDNDNARSGANANSKTGANGSRTANVYVDDRGVITGDTDYEVPFPITPGVINDGANSSDTDAEENNGHKTKEEEGSHPPGRANNKGVKFGAVTDLSGPEPEASGPVRQKQRTPKAPSGPVGAKREITKRDKVSQVLTECFAAAWGLVSMPTYLLAVASATLSAYLPAGYRTHVARFVRTQYHYDLPSAIFYTDGLCYSLAHAAGSLLGGYIIWKMRLSLPQQLRLIICALAINIFFFFLIFSVGCWSEGDRWQNSSAIISGSDDRRCAKDCDCSSVQFQPICSKDGASFTSPCDAGCTRLLLRDSNIVYTSCSCVSTVPSEASSSFCNTCSAFGGFWFLLFLSIFAHSVAYVSILLVFLRVVAEEKRQLSLSLAVWIVALGAYVPGTAVFRGIESSSCLKWSTDCQSESVCVIHSVDRLRYTLHGANIAFQGAAIAGCVLILFVLKELNPCRRTSEQEHDLDPGQDRPRRNSSKMVAASSGVILLDGGGAVDGDLLYQDSPEGTGSSSMAEDVRLPGSYVSPVFEMDEDDDGGSWDTEEGSWMVEDGLGRGEALEMAKVNGNVMELDRVSGESSL